MSESVEGNVMLDAALLGAGAHNPWYINCQITGAECTPVEDRLVAVFRGPEPGSRVGMTFVMPHDGVSSADISEWRWTIEERVGEEMLTSTLNSQEWDEFMRVGRWLTSVNGQAVAWPTIRQFMAGEIEEFEGIDPLEFDGGPALDDAAELGGPARRIRAAMSNMANRADLAIGFAPEPLTMPTGHDSCDRHHGTVTVRSDGSSWDEHGREVKAVFPWRDHVTGGGRVTAALEELPFGVMVIFAGTPERGYTLAEVALTEADAPLVRGLGTQALLEQLHQDDEWY